MSNVKLIDTGAAAFMLGTTPNAVRIYACRYPARLPRRGRDDHGRTLYAMEDVERILDGRPTRKDERMKRADIADEHVLELAQRWSDNPAEPGVVDALMAEGIPRKLALAKVDHMVRRGLLDYGVSPYYAWPLDQYRSRMVK